MFPRGQRLAKSTDVMRTLQRGRKSSLGPLRCSLYVTGAELRLTVIISKKTAKRAVDRNLIKRRVRAALRTLPLPTGDLAISLFNGTPDFTYQQLHSALSLCLAKLS